MVELTLVFFLGALVAGLFGVLLLPLIWQRARRLTRQHFERALPLDTNEILAERDRDRAVFAVKTLVADQRLDALQAQVLVAKGEVGAAVAREARLLEEAERRNGQIRALEATLGEIRATLVEREKRLETVEAQLTQARDALEALGQDQAAQRVRLLEAETGREQERRLREEFAVQLAAAQAAEAEERARVSALRLELQERAQALRLADRAAVGQG